MILGSEHHVTNNHKLLSDISGRFRLLTQWLESESESELLYDSRFTVKHFVLATSPLRLTTSNFIFQLNTFGYSPYVTSSLMRGWVCRLQLLLVLASAVILRSESRWTHDHILLSQIQDSPNTEGQVPVFISPRNRVARLYPQALGSLFVASYDSQGYSGGNWPCLHTDKNDAVHGWPNTNHREADLYVRLPVDGPHYKLIYSYF
jgi:hypothetical protein